MDYEPNHFNFSIHFFTVNVMAQKRLYKPQGATSWVSSPQNLRNSTMMSFLVRCGAVPINSACATAVWLQLHRSSVRALPTAR